MLVHTVLSNPMERYIFVHEIWVFSKVILFKDNNVGMVSYKMEGSRREKKKKKKKRENKKKNV